MLINLDFDIELIHSRSCTSNGIDLAEIGIGVGISGANILS